MTGLVDRLATLEGVVRSRLEPGEHERARLLTQAAAYGDEFLNAIGTIPAYVETEEQGKGLYASPFGEEPSDLAPLLGLIGRHVDRPGLNPASGGHLGYIPGGGLYASALGDYLADITNRYAGLLFASPGAVRMENMLIRWMSSIAGYPRASAGNLTSGGSIANLIGIVTAREAMGIHAREIPRSVIYSSEHAHHSLDKAIRIAGMRECVVRNVPLNERYQMRADELERLVAADQASGLKPWLVIGSAGTTDVGAVDPLEAIGELAARHDLWFHCDGAYGGFFVLCEEGKKAVKGMETTHSLVMDPHKGLFLPYGTGAVLVRESRKLWDAHYYVANYMQDAAAVSDELSPADLSPELTKHFRGLRFWLPLKLAGIGAFRAALEEKLLLARYFYERMSEIEGFELGPYPELSVVTYRYLPKRGDPQEFNRRLVEEVRKDGRVFVSSTMLDGRFTLRLAVLSFRTHRETIDLAIRILREKVKRIEED